MEPFQGKVAVITGGGKGIGRGIALLFARQGIDVIIADLDASAGESVASEIESLGRKSLAVEADVSDVADVDRIFDQALKSFGRVDILVNNAGISHPAVSILDLDISYLDRVFDVNYKSVYLCSRRAGKQMAQQKGGCIINISSVGGQIPLASVIYSSLKSAVNMLTRILARDFARFGVRVNCVAPGFVMTPLLQESIDKGIRDPSLILNYVPMHTFMEPGDIAEVALFLASEKACHITGSIITADAGFSSEGGWAAYSIGHEPHNEKNL